MHFLIETQRKPETKWMFSNVEIMPTASVLFFFLTLSIFFHGFMSIPPAEVFFTTLSHNRHEWGAPGKITKQNLK